MNTLIFGGSISKEALLQGELGVPGLGMDVPLWEPRLTVRASKLEEVISLFNDLSKTTSFGGFRSINTRCSRRM
ncbi:hypothetical protein OF83DRAFT_1150130 [Amylostereum chailletii]|nr:hypothetical protein OF83DRAFT_1150130 [Amylostereum chailletii]